RGGDPLRLAGHRRRGHLRCHDLRSDLPPRAAPPRRDGRAAPLRRDAVRSRRRSRIRARYERRPRCPPVPDAGTRGEPLTPEEAAQLTPIPAYPTAVRPQPAMTLITSEIRRTSGAIRCVHHLSPDLRGSAR